MNFTVNKNILLKYINLLLGVTASKSTVPILEKALFKIEKEKVTLLGTDFERSIKISFSAKVETEGEFVADPRRIKALTEYDSQIHDLTLSLSDNSLLIRSDDGSMEADLGTFDPEEFPSEPAFTQEYEFLVKAEELNRAIGAVEFAAASDLTRVEFNSVFFDSGTDYFNLVSTDSIVLAKTKIPCINSVFSFILPIKSVRMLKSFFTEGDISIHVSKNLVLFKGDDLIFTSRIIDGKFPDYERVIPKSISNKVVLNAKDLSQGAKLIQGWGQQNQGINLTVNAEKKTLVCESDKGHGHVSKKINIQSADSDVKIRFYVDKLLSVLKNMNGNIEVMFSDEAQQVLIKDTEADRSEYVLMPQRSE